MGDIKCHVCKRPLSSSGREMGIAVFNPEFGWTIVCATKRCVGIPEDIKISELQNYWLNKEAP